MLARLGSPFAPTRGVAPIARTSRGRAGMADAYGPGPSGVDPVKVRLRPPRTKEPEAVPPPVRYSLPYRPHRLETVCRQPKEGACRGFHGRGSDPTNAEAWCYLDARTGDPRAYWRLAEKYLTKDALHEQAAQERCPLLDTYQLMRNFFFAAEWAETEHKAHHAAVVIVPSSRSAKLSQQVEDFRALLRPEERGFVTLAPYEDYISALDSLGGVEGKVLATFLSDAIVREERLDRFTWHADDVEVLPPA